MALIIDIRNLDISEEFRAYNFVASSYQSEQNKRQPEYLMTRDGFVILAMGYTGKRRFNDNRKRFVRGVDYFKISPSEFRTTKFVERLKLEISSQE